MSVVCFVRLFIYLVVLIMFKKETLSQEEKSVSEVRGRIRNSVRQVSKSRVDLEISPSVRVGVFVYIKTKHVVLPTLKKIDASCGGPIKVDRTYSKLEDPDTCVDNKLIAMRYGGEYVPIPDLDREAMKFVSEKCLRVIGFFPKEFFQPQYWISNAECVAAEPGNTGAASALNALISETEASGCAALCRFSYRANAEPKLVVLFPSVIDECFYSVQVAYSEDSRENSLLFPSLPAASEDLLDTIDELINGRMLVEGNRELLLPELTLNPTLDRFWASVDARIADPKAELAPFRLEESMHPERYLFSNQKEIDLIGSRIAKLAKLEEHTEDDEATKKRKRFWRESQINNLIESPKKEDVKKIRIESAEEAEFEQRTRKL